MLDSQFFINLEQAMVRFLKQGRTEEQSESDAAQVQSTVSGILADIGKRGDEALLEYSRKFDQWGPESFRLTDVQIQDCMAQLSAGQLDDIRFAQAQIRNFAQLQKESLRDVEVETIPGVILGHKNLPVESVACYVPGGKFPLVASAHMGVVTAKVAGVPRVVASSPVVNGKPSAAVVAAMHLAGADEIYTLGGVQAIGAFAIGTASIRPTTMVIGPGNAYVPRQNDSYSAGSGSICWRDRRRPWSSLMIRSMPSCALRTCSGRLNTATTRPRS